MVKKPAKVHTISTSVGDENLEKLRTAFSQFVKDREIDFDALRVFFDKEGILAGEEKYGLSWAGKSDAFRAIQTSATGTLAPQEKESKHWDKTRNLFIEGDNLEVLKLLQKHYRGAVKMIYIDPPYNTGKDFIYKDNFRENRSDYYERTGQTKGGIRLESSAESSGRYHSDWLTMMYPRLFLAKNLLRDDGVIFISIDDHEVYNLRHIMDEIFGEENFFGTITWQSRTKPKNIGGARYSLQQNVEYILTYGKVPSDNFNFELPEVLKKSYSESDDHGEYRLEEMQQRKNLGSMRRDSMVYTLLGITPRENYRWQLSPEKRDSLLSEGKLIKIRNRIYHKIYKDEEQEFSHEPFWSHRIDADTAESAKEDLEQLMEADDIFDTVKPLNLITQLLLFLPTDSLVLDFFAGSGTTAHAVMAQNAEDGGDRKYICVQLPEATDEKSEAYKAGYTTIAEIDRERIRRAGEEIGKGDTGFKSYALSPSNYREWSVITDEKDAKKLKEQMKIFAEKPLVDGYDEKNVVYEVLLKEGFDLNAEVIQRKQGSLDVWVVADDSRRLVIFFAKKLTKKQIDSLNLTKDDLFVCLDTALDDSTKLNITKNLTVKVI